MQKMSRRPLIVAHEGCENTIPHTVDSVLAGYAAGADMVEIDIRATRDFVIVLQHDGQLLVDGSPTDLASITFSRLTELALADRLQSQGPKTITLLDEVLDVVKANGGALNLDVKEDAAVDPAARLVSAKKMEASVIFTGCEQERARSLRAQFPHLQVLLNASDHDYEVSRKDHSRFVHTFCSLAISSGCSGVNVHFSHCTQELVDYAAMHFLPVSVWTVDEPADQMRVAALGVHSITTHRVRALVDLLRKTPLQ